MTEPRYTHFFDVRLAVSFDSDIEDFDDALDAWLESFPTNESRRKALLSSDESTKSLIKGIVYSETHDNLATSEYKITFGLAWEGVVRFQSLEQLQEAIQLIRDSDYFAAIAAGAIDKGSDVMDFGWTALADDKDITNTPSPWLQAPSVSNPSSPATAGHDK